MLIFFNFNKEPLCLEIHAVTFIGDNVFGSCFEIQGGLENGS